MFAFSLGTAVKTTCESSTGNFFLAIAISISWAELSTFSRPFGNSDDIHVAASSS